jgi:hypothetical protein
VCASDDPGFAVFECGIASWASVPTPKGVMLSVADEEIDRLMQMAERIMDENREVLRALAK